MTGPLPVVCAHRGDLRRHPENTPPAFESAIRLGAEALEADLRRTPDGRLVLAHDPLTEAAARTAAPLAALLALADGRVGLDVELKEAGYELDVLAALEPRPQRLLVTSFLPEAVAAVHAADPALATGLLIEPGDGGGALLARAAACGASHLAPHWSLVDDALLAEAAAAAVPLVVWTVNETAELERLAAAPAVTIVITDDPPAAVAARRRAGRRGPDPLSRRR